MEQGLSAAIAGFVIATISAAGYLGVIGLMAIESACIPLPSEIIMPFSGYLVSTGRFDLVLAASAGAAGCNLGSTIAYALGRYGGRPVVEKWGAYVLISRHDLAAADRFFSHYGGLAVLIGRVLPVIRTFISFPAGVARVSQLKFQLLTFVGSWPWCFALAYVGYRLGRAWNTDRHLQDLMHRSDAIVAAVLALALCWYVWRHIRHARG
jgi:membrane protein DedA with SNARE-associated domain